MRNLFIGLSAALVLMSSAAMADTVIDKPKRDVCYAMSQFEMICIVGDQFVTVTTNRVVRF
jgi:hypothetical protein